MAPLTLSAGCYVQSRDGFHYSRPGPGQPWPAQGYNLSRSHRVPFAPETSSFDRTRWNWAEVLSYAGAIAVHPDRLQLFLSGRSGHGEIATGTATVRRDGFCAMVTGNAPGTLTTKPLILGGRFLFANLNGTARVSVLASPGAKAALPGYAADLSVGATQRTDSTRLRLSWQQQTMLPQLKDGETIALRFELGPDSELYSFWASEWSTGESGGFVAAGGPGFKGSRDVHM